MSPSSAEAPLPSSLAPGAWLVCRRELAANARSWLAWFVPVAALLGLTIALQPSIAGEHGVLAAKLAALPEALRRGMGLTTLDFDRPPAYLATNFLYVTLTGSLFAGLLGANIVAKEEAFHTAELLLTLPVSRARVLAGKAMAVVALVFGFQLALAAFALGCFSLVTSRPLEPALIAQLFGGTFALGLCFAGAGMFVAAVLRHPRTAPGVALGLVFGTYFLGVAAGASEKVERLRWLSPYKYVEPSKIVSDGGLSAGSVLLLSLVGFGCVVAAVARFERKDIHA